VLLRSRSRIRLHLLTVALVPSLFRFSAKKRLRTMLKNPTKKANAKALVAHLALIHRYSKEDDEHKPIYNPVIGDLVKVDVPEDVDETTMRKIKFDDDGDENHAADDDHDMVDDSVVDHEAEMHVDAKQVVSELSCLTLGYSLCILTTILANILLACYFYFIITVEFGIHEFESG
jgi:hypothetical protein